MKSSVLKFVLSLTALAALFLAGAMSFEGVARAATFELAPVKVTLDGTTRSSVVTVRNASTEPLRLQVSAFGWKQSPSGEMQLEPTSDVVFFPSLLSLAPGESRAIRVGATAFPTVEAGYRIFVEEMPPVRSPGNFGGIRMLTRIGIPVFVQAAPGTAIPAIGGMHQGPSALALSLRNDGTAHLMANKLRVTGHTRDGRTTFEQELVPWYVLAGGKRDVVVIVPKAVCADTTSFELAAETTGGDVTSTYDKACVP